MFGDVKGLGEGTDYGACQSFFRRRSLSSHNHLCNRDRRILQPFMCSPIKPMANRFSRNKEGMRPNFLRIIIRHIRNGRVRDQVPHVRFPLATVSPSPHGLIAHPLMLDELLSKRSHDNVSRSITRSQTSPTQTTSSTCCRSPMPTSRSASKGVGDHVVRGERSLESFVDGFEKRGSRTFSASLSASPADAPQRRGLPLARPRIAGDTACLLDAIATALSADHLRL